MLKNSYMDIEKLSGLEFMQSVAEGKIIHLSPKIGVAESTLKDAEGNLYACATATCLIYR